MVISKWISFYKHQVSIGIIYIKMLLYKMHYLPVPLNESTSHATMLDEQKPYFAVTASNEYYAFPSEAMISGIQSDIGCPKT